MTSRERKPYWIRADDSPPPPTERYSIADKEVVCPHCGHDEFIVGRAQLHTAGLTFLGLEWANRSANTLLCGVCGRIEWYMTEPERR